MELNESIESLNRQLQELFGIESTTGDAIFRISWAPKQREKRHGTYNDFTPGGIFIRTVTEVREAPKYQWIGPRYILERLVVVPEVSMSELPTTKLSYEPIWVFETQSGEYLPPRIDAAKLIIDTMYAALGKAGLRKYVDNEVNETQEGREHRIQQLQNELFGNETPATDALAYHTGVTVPHPMIKES